MAVNTLVSRKMWRSVCLSPKRCLQVLIENINTICKAFKNKHENLAHIKHCQLLFSIFFFNVISIYHKNEGLTVDTERCTFTHRKHYASHGRKGCPLGPHTNRKYGTIYLIWGESWKFTLLA